MNKKYRVVLTISGSDSGGGAGMQADLKTVSALGCYATTVITALTAQNTQGVQAIQTLPSQFIQAQLDSVFADFDISAVKIGMLHNQETVDVVYQAIKKYKPRNIIIDPIMFAQSGASLVEPNVIAYLKKTLFPLANLVTPNIPEAEHLCSEKINSKEDVFKCAQIIAKQGRVPVLIKGGHSKDTEDSSDLFYDYVANNYFWITEQRINTINAHGTGCTLSSAIAAHLAMGMGMRDAINVAKQYLTQALKSGASYKIGHGCGPVNHFYQWHGSFE